MFGIIDFQYDVSLPNEILQDMKDWFEEGMIKSVQHQEFIYSYYWLLAYLWRYALYSEHKITQSEIKKILRYNPNDSRLNYIMKKDGLLDNQEYTLVTGNYPISWSKKDKEDVQFTMLCDLDEDYRRYINKFDSSNNFVKAPVKHIGDEDEEGLFWNPSNSHLMSGRVFSICMRNRNLGCAGFYLYGILSFIRDKSKSDEFPCSNQTLVTYTGWSLGRVTKVTNELKSVRLVGKEQLQKTKGSVNMYKIFNKSN